MSSRKHPDRFCGPRNSFPGVKRPRPEADHLYLVPRLRISGTTPLLPHMPSQNIQEHASRHFTFPTLTSEKLLPVGTCFHPEDIRIMFPRNIHKMCGCTVSHRVIRLVIYFVRTGINTLGCNFCLCWICASLNYNWVTCYGESNRQCTGKSESNGESTINSRCNSSGLYLAFFFLWLHSLFIVEMC